MNRLVYLNEIVTFNNSLCVDLELMSLIHYAFIHIKTESMENIL